MAYGDYIWEVRAYYDGNLRGLADDFATDDWEEVKDKVHEYISDGHVVEIKNSETGVRQVWDYDGYFEDFEGESPLFYDDFYAREDEKEFNKNYDFGSFKGESILSDYEYIHRKLGDEIWNALDEYCEMMNGELFLSDVLYKESEWKRFEKWFEKTYKKSIQDSSKYYGESRVNSMKLNLGEGRENPYKGNFGGERTNYQIVGDDRYMKLYSKGNDKKPDELFNDVTRNYITDKEDLEAIQDLLWANNRDDEAEIVGYYIEEIDEEKKYGDNYSVARMKIDLALDNYFGGFEQVPIGDNLLLSCWEQDGRICINIEDFSDGKYGQVYNVFTPEEIMNMSREDFDRAVNDTWYYGEPNYDYDDED